MPHLSLQISLLGPLLDIRVGVSTARAEALIQAVKPIPVPVQIRGLIDTGASGTCIDVGTLKALGVTPTGTVPIMTPSTGAVPHFCNQYDVSLTLIHPTSQLLLNTWGVMEAQLAAQGIQALIGRDILSQCLFVYDGQSGNFSLAF